MSRPNIRRWLSFAGLTLALLMTTCATLLGPWPVYSDSNYETSAYFRDAIDRIEQEVAGAGWGAKRGDLRAGWASRDITPPVGAPMAGYSAREDGKRSTGIRDRLHARAVAFSDGEDETVIVVGDMLVVPPRIAEAVRENLAGDPGLGPGEILFNATHTHCGPGGFAPGLASRITGGAYDPEIETMLVRAMTEAAREALDTMVPVEMASGQTHEPRYIENRVRDDAPVDDELAFISLRGEDGRQALLVSYAAHPTVFGKRMLEFSRDYPGALQDELKAKTGAEVIFLSGAVGSMGDDAPKAPSKAERMELMGRGLARSVLSQLDTMEYGSRVDVAAFGLPIGMPPIQIRPVNADFRVSPWLARRIGLDRKGWLHFLRLNHVLFVGLPFDFSGETSLEWKDWARERDLDLWPTSFSGHYCGYLSPDRYYLDEPLGYETGEMNWYGPNLEAYMTDLFHRAVAELEAGVLAPDPPAFAAMN